MRTQCAATFFAVISAQYNTKCTYTFFFGSLFLKASPNLKLCYLDSPWLPVTVWLVCKHAVQSLVLRPTGHVEDQCCVVDKQHTLDISMNQAFVLEYNNNPWPFNTITMTFYYYYYCEQGIIFFLLQMPGNNITAQHNHTADYLAEYIWVQVHKRSYWLTLHTSSYGYCIVLGRHWQLCLLFGDKKAIFNEMWTLNLMTLPGALGVKTLSSHIFA